MQHCAINRKVAGSIGIFRTMAVESTQSYNKSTRNISWVVKVDGAQGGHPSYIYELDCPEILCLLKPEGPVQACNGIEKKYT